MFAFPMAVENNQGGNEDGLVSRENNRCALPFCVGNVVTAAKIWNSRVPHLAVGAECLCVSVHRLGPCRGERHSKIRIKVCLLRNWGSQVSQIVFSALSLTLCC